MKKEDIIFAVFGVVMLSAIIYVIMLIKKNQNAINVSKE